MLATAPDRDGARVGLSSVNSSPPAAHCTAATVLAVGSAELWCGWLHLDAAQDQQVVAWPNMYR